MINSLPYNDIEINLIKLADSPNPYLLDEGRYEHTREN